MNLLSVREFLVWQWLGLLPAVWLFFAIKNKNISQHKEWMVRSYVVTNGFVTFRLIFNVLFSIEQFPFKNDLGGVSAWACWSIPLLITEWILQEKKIKRQSISKARLSIKEVHAHNSSLNKQELKNES
jgi:hypothetical protein